ncbi:MAG: UvrD-helicase domain-containing protein, partial [Propionibacteriaceae bacterium]|nr:UvrD-helicase domain-containing protein [Propionibacteriaceae bacterium]
MTSFPSFDLAAPLPTGLTVLEASAGTGKTWAIAALTVRYLADGLVDAPHLLAVTFTHLASADLRARLYQRLVTTTDMVTQRRAGQSTPPDQLVDVICDGTDQVVNARLARLRQAIGDFDAATVATIHEFCRRAGDWLGGERPPRIDDEDSAALADQTIADLTLARLLSGANDLTADACASLGQAALANPELPIVPGNDQAGEFAKACREEYARRKRTAEVDDFADMAMRLDHVLSDPGTSERVADALAQRFHVVLVDEFQDTDPVQWSILRHAFVGRRPLVLVGDPKQSIYGFRGADVYAYLDAVAHSDATYTLPINYRSDDAVVQAVNQVFTEVDFGLMSAPIPMRISQAAHTSPRLRQGPSGPSLSGLQIRRVATSGAKQRAVIDADLVAWVVDALATHPQLMRDDGRWRAVRADDIAVLVGSNRHGESLNQALRQAGVPAVFSGVASVFASPAADEWLTLLDALAHPRPATLRRAMAGRLIGLPLGDLADAACDQPVTWSARLRGWAGLRLGPAAIIDQLNDLTDMPARLLGLADGERLLTDVRHLSELLAQQARRLTDLSELVVWLRAQRRRAVESGGGDRTRRLETDRPAVAVLTVHAAKGLEFPIVLVPAAADAPRHTWGSPDYPMLWRDSGHRVLDTRSGGPGQATRWHAWAEEQASEERRRLYVALTRA